MINTQCPDCSARFYVAEDLVEGKIVHFRCRKCGGTLKVDGIMPISSHGPITLKLSGNASADAQLILGAAITMPRATILRAIGLIRRRQARTVSWTPQSPATNKPPSQSNPPPSPV